MLKKWLTFGGLRNSFEQPYGPACNCYAAIRNRENKQTKTKEMDMDINSRPYSSGRQSSKVTWSFNDPESPGEEVIRLKGFIHHFTHRSNAEPLGHEGQLAKGYHYASAGHIPSVHRGWSPEGHLPGLRSTQSTRQRNHFHQIIYQKQPKYFYV